MSITIKRVIGSLTIAACGLVALAACDSDPTPSAALDPVPSSSAISSSSSSSSTNLSSSTSTSNVTDTAYLLALQSGNIFYSSPDAAISAGHSVCSAMDEGLTMPQAILAIANAKVYSLEQSGYIFGAATAAYCPRYEPQVN